MAFACCCAGGGDQSPVQEVTPEPFSAKPTYEAVPETKPDLAPMAKYEEPQPKQEPKREEPNYSTGYAEAKDNSAPATPAYKEKQEPNAEPPPPEPVKQEENNQAYEESPPSLPAGACFIKLEKKTPKDKLGLDVSFTSDKKRLVVASVKAGKMTDVWNQANPDSKIATGDEIFEVNKQRDDSKKMLDICVQDAVLEVYFLRAKDCVG